MAKRTRRYILGNFAKSFLLVFLPFLLIVSLVFLVQVSILSSRINLSTTELLQFFVYLLPEILLYTIPFSLVAALANLFNRLSEENELVALFALGHSPRRIFAFMLPSLSLFGAILLVLSFLLYPQMKQKANAFKHQKLAEATLKISPNKLSQSFGSYHVYVAAKEGNGYRDIVLLDNHDPKKRELFIAERADSGNEGQRLGLTLHHGIGETSDEKKIDTLRYQSLTIYQYPRFSRKKFLSFREYWALASRDKGRRGKLLYFLMISLSPLTAFPLIAAFGIFNPRYRKANSALAIFLVALAIYIPAAMVHKSGNLTIFALSMILLLAGGVLLLRRRVLRYF